MTGDVVDAVARAIFHADDMAAKPSFAWGDTTAASYRAMALAAIGALEAERTISTVEQLDALPCGAVIGFRVDDDVTVYERVITEDGLQWWTDGDHDPAMGADDLPALVLWNPSWVSVVRGTTQ